MLAILRAMFHLNIEYHNPELIVIILYKKKFKNLIKKESQLVFATVHANKEELTVELSAAMQLLWKDKGVQECYKRSNEYQIDDSAK